MNAERLVDMVNQISRFFESQPVHEDAVTGVADHLKRFWDPRMRNAIIAHVAQGGAGLRELGLEAVRRLEADARIRRVGS